MAKTKTSKKQGFSLEKMKTVTLKKDVKVFKNESSKHLKDSKTVKSTLLQCIADDDIESFREILQAHLDVINITRFSEDAGLSRRTIYNMLKPDSNPTLKNITKLLSCISA